MNWLKNLRIGVRMVLMLALPLLATAYFGGGDIIAKRQSALDMQQLEALASLSVRLGSLAHELQRERGMSAGFIGSSGRDFAADMPAQRSASDQRAAELQAELDRIPDDQLGSDLKQSIEAARQRLKLLGERREAISRLTLPAPQAVSYYSELIGELLRSTEIVATLSRDGQVGRIATAYAAFMQAKERAGVERALLTNAFAADRFANGGFNRFWANAAEQTTYAAVFQALALPDQVGFYREQAKATSFAEVDDMKRRAAE
ncbi:MAG: nitrate- and nitrite sensing domain-containing protein, partial [Burkholderiales bacterium]|nr:nitrate- and nitrite sensing domain-containing protein [Burkholderiales bacterium]